MIHIGYMHACGCGIVLLRHWWCYVVGIVVWNDWVSSSVYTHEDCCEGMISRKYVMKTYQGELREMEYIVFLSASIAIEHDSDAFDCMVPAVLVEQCGVMADDVHVVEAVYRRHYCQHDVVL